MTPQLRAAKVRLKAVINDWRYMVPPGWDVRHTFIEGVIDEERHDVVAETKAQWEYHQATIRWSLSAIAALDDAYLAGTVVHELVHVLTSGLEQLLRTDDDDKPGTTVNAICEHTVETIARAFLRVAL